MDIPYNVDNGLLSMAWNKHQQFINYFMNKMAELGQMDHILLKWKVRPRSDCGSRGDFVSIRIDNIISAFVRVILCIILGTVILLLELGLKSGKPLKDFSNMFGYKNHRSPL